MLVLASDERENACEGRRWRYLRFRVVQIDFERELKEKRFLWFAAASVKGRPCSVAAADSSVFAMSGW